jgi:hypothetical protein
MMLTAPGKSSFDEIVLESQSLGCLFLMGQKYPGTWSGANQRLLNCCFSWMNGEMQGRKFGVYPQRSIMF